MLSDKEQKKVFKKHAQENPEKYYPVRVLENKGFTRKQCPICNNFFWSRHSETCGDPNCSGGFNFIGNSPAKRKLDYLGVWKEFSKMFKKFGYTPIQRYPVAARWRDDTDFVQASIYDFQPYVVNGSIKPPANPLTVPQFCLRFNDIDNVGITGSHYTGFVMIGQHAFYPPDKYNQEQYFMDIGEWLNKGLGLSDDEITFHEDAWAGGGNFGPSIEFYSRGLELGNQVYMMFEQTEGGGRELKLKVLDMGMGQERNAWFTKGVATSYESTFPTVMDFLEKKTKIKVKDSLMKKYLPYAPLLNVDETEDIDKAWKEVSKKSGIGLNNLRENVLPLSAMYSIAEHTRSLLFALNDGVLPSNVGGGYNLRVILRRALKFIDEHKWDIDMGDLCELHAKYLKPQYPELINNLDEIREILNIEKEKYEGTKIRSKDIIQKIKNKKLKDEDLVRLYDTEGIQPEMLGVKTPDNFYMKVSELHQKSKKIEEREEGVSMYYDIPATKRLYYDDNIKEFKAIVLNHIDDCIILDKTAFYPTSGGQEHDTGYIGDSKVIDVKKEGDLIIHKVDRILVNEGQEVNCKIDWDRRKQLTQNHSAVHVINGSSRKILGDHVWQAGSEVKEEKARLDITHYSQLTPEQTKEIEDEANNIIKKKLEVKKMVLPRNVAEKRYGFRLYQGGAVPGEEIRVLNIKNFDVEACGGTHVNNTSEIKLIKIIKTSKISDGVVRIELVAGDKAVEFDKKEENLLKETAKILNVKPEEVPARAEELFEKWKLSKKGSKVEKLNIKKVFKGDIKEILNETAKIFKTQIDYVPKTAERFLKEIKF